MNEREIAKLLLDNISDINVGNMLKIKEHINIKSTDKDGVEFIDVLEAIKEECISRYHKCDDMAYYAHIAILIIETERYLLKHTSANTLHALDTFLIKMRELSL